MKYVFQVLAVLIFGAIAAIKLVLFVSSVLSSLAGKSVYDRS